MHTGILPLKQKAARFVAPLDTPGGETAGQEALLVRAAQTGDLSALQTLLTREERPLFSVCHGILGNATEAEDAMQETFLLALRALARPNGFRGQCAFRTWLLRIGINVCLGWRRGQRPCVPLHEIPAEFAAAQTGPEQEILTRMRLREALSALAPRHRALLILREQDGYSVAEIADLLQWKPKKVHNELFKARQTLLRWREREEK